MLISFNWLSDWVDISKLSVEEILSKITVSGLEVAAVEEVGVGHDKIVIGKISSIEPHPKADRLVVCRVDAGEGELRTIVCGAKNMKEGDCVPVALPGSQPPGIDFEIVERQVMGVVSSGMLCAKEELALEESSEGLWILPEEVEKGIGEPIFDYLGIRDTVVEIEVTPNRPDALSHRGVARDIAALFGLSLRTPEERLQRLPQDLDLKAEVASESLSVTLKSPLDVHYALAAIQNVDVVESPVWLQLLLAKVGLKPINAIVDVTNFVMFDIGQPLHAFDSDVTGGKIVVRQGDEGETFAALNHKTYTLTADDLVISNDQGAALALAGVMGGLDSEVTEKTKNILLECAYFSPVSIRKTSKRLAIHSDASHRYERGIDPIAIPENLSYTLKFFAHIFRCTLPDPLPMVVADNLESLEPTCIRFCRGEYERLIGAPIEQERMVSIFTSLGLDVAPVEGSDACEVTIPGFRPDLERPVDLVEELARIVGLNSISGRSTFLVSGDEYIPRKSVREGVGGTLVSRPFYRWQLSLRERLIACGFYEHVSYSFMSENDLDSLLFVADDPRRTDRVAIANPLTVEQAFMRTTMLPGMLAAAKLNATRRQFNLPLFEIGRTYSKEEERLKLALFAAGKREEHFSVGETDWDFFSFKGMLEDLFDRHGLALEAVVPEVLEPFLHPGVQATLYAVSKGGGREKVGVVGQLHPKVRGALQGPIFFAEMDLEKLVPDFHDTPCAKNASKFQAVSRDFAFVVPQSTSWQSIKDSILNAASRSAQLASDLRSCDVFDVYEGEQVAPGHRSIAIAIVYQSEDKTLTEQEITAYDQLILSAVEQDLGLTLRS